MLRVTSGLILRRYGNETSIPQHCIISRCVGGTQEVALLSVKSKPALHPPQYIPCCKHSMLCRGTVQCCVGVLSTHIHIY